MTSILLIRLSSLGDVILATPLVRRLAHTYPGARIDVVVAERFADVWKHNPYVTTIWAIPRQPPAAELDARKLELLSILPEGRYDLILDLQRNLRSSTLRRGLGPTVVAPSKHRMEKLAMVWLKRRPERPVHVVDRYGASLAPRPLTMDAEGCEVWTERERRQGWYGGASGGTGLRWAVAVGAHHATKQWPVVRFAELCRTLVDDHGMTPVLVGGNADVPIADAVAAAAGVAVERADGASTLEQTIDVLDTCAGIVTNDTGVMHLAAARRLPVVAIFGSTVPELGFTPYGVPYRIVQADVSCRPCSHIGRSRCPKGHFRCMLDVGSNAVVAAVLDLQSCKPSASSL